MTYSTYVLKKNTLDSCGVGLEDLVSLGESSLVESDVQTQGRESQVQLKVKFRETEWGLVNWLWTSESLELRQKAAFSVEWEGWWDLVKNKNLVKFEFPINSE